MGTWPEETNDAVRQLMQRIQNDLTPPAQSSQTSSSNFLSQLTSLIASAANYAQIVGTAEGPIAQALAATTDAVTSALSAQIKAAQMAEAAAIADGNAADAAMYAGQVADLSGSAAEATALAGVTASGVGAALVLILALVLTATAAANQSGSSETQLLNQLNEEIQAIADQLLLNYWSGKMTTILTSWDPPGGGGVGGDLDDLANEGTAGFDVVNDVANYHKNGMGFVNLFIPSKTLGTAQGFWERPIAPGQGFSAQPVPYPISPLGVPPDTPLTPGGYDIAIGQIMGWYGTLPVPQAGQSLGDPGPMVLDPRTMLPFLLIGLQSYLTLEMVAYVIDGSQPTIFSFVSSFRGDLQDYADFLLMQYNLAVGTSNPGDVPNTHGIVKSDIPSVEDLLSYLYFVAEVEQSWSFPDNTIWWGGSPPFPAPPFQPGADFWPFSGYAWNGVYGAVDANPKYGLYEPSPPVPVPGSSLSYLIDFINTDNLGAEFSQVFTDAPTQYYTVSNWTAPWLQNKLILGTMARWKAIYLINGYDKVWPILQNLRALSGQPQLPIMTLDQDGTIADGNWSAREICTVLNVDASVLAGGPILDGVQNSSLTTAWGEGPVIGQPQLYGYSLFSLTQLLDNIASGNFAGPPSYSSQGIGPTRPIGFRDRLAAAAV